MRLNIKNKVNNDQQSKMSGIYPVISINSNTYINNASVVGPTLTYNNSNLVIHKCRLDNKNHIILNNSIVNITENVTSQNITVNIQNNSFYNILPMNQNTFSRFKIPFNNVIDYVIYSNTPDNNSSTTYQVISDTTYKTIYNVVQTANLFYDYSTKQIKWQNSKKNSIFLYDVTNIDNISIENEEFTDTYNVVSGILHDHNLAGGFYKTINFNIHSNKQLINSTVSGFTLQNSKNRYIFSSSPNHNIKFKSPITINNVEYVQLSYFGLFELNANNSNIKINFYGKNKQANQPNALNCPLSFNTSKIQIDEQIVDYESIQNSYIKINKSQISNIQYNSSIEYYPGYSILVSGDSDNEQDINTILPYDTYPENGNIVQHIATTTNACRNNNYRYGLESHTHKMFVNDFSNQSDKATLFPTESLINHEILTNKKLKSLLTQQDTCSYYQPENAFKSMYIPQRSIMPIGSIIHFYQIRKDRFQAWEPQIPDGYYQVTSDYQNIRIDIDDSNTHGFNGQFVKLYEDKIKKYKNIKLDRYNGYSILHNFNLYNNGAEADGAYKSNHDYNFRIIKIIKYAERGNHRIKKDINKGEE